METATHIAILVIAALLLVIVALCIPLLRTLNRFVQRSTDLMDRVEPELVPTLANVRNVSENLSEISERLKEDMASISDTVQETNDRVRATVELAQERISSFAAMLELVEDEARDLVMGTVSSLRGIGKGVRMLKKMVPWMKHNEDDE